MNHSFDFGYRIIHAVCSTELADVTDGFRRARLDSQTSMSTRIERWRVLTRSRIRLTETYWAVWKASMGRTCGGLDSDGKLQTSLFPSQISQTALPRNSRRMWLTSTAKSMSERQGGSSTIITCSKQSRIIAMSSIQEIRSTFPSISRLVSLEKNPVYSQMSR